MHISGSLACLSVFSILKIINNRKGRRFVEWGMLLLLHFKYFHILQKQKKKVLPHKHAL